MNDDELDEFTAALHDVVLPLGVPVLPGLDLAAHFSVPADPGESTGAWFDVVQLRSGRVGLVMGQVPGSGPAAVAGASAVGAVLRSSLLCDEDVAAAVKNAALFAEHTSSVTGTTVAVSVIDPVGRELSYATAGHASPLLASVDGEVRDLDRTGSRPLGAGSDAVAARLSLDVGDLVVLSSAPTTETGPAEGHDRGPLLTSARVPGDASATCEAYAGGLARQQTKGAVSVLVAEVRDIVWPDLDLDLPVDPDTTRQARHALADWLSTVSASQTDVLSLTHAAAELVTNAVEHAYAGAADGSEAAVHLQASHTDDGEVQVDVVDAGQWRPPGEDDIGRGRGLAMAAGLVDDLVVTTTDDGTRARLLHRLSRPVVVDRTPLRAAWAAAEPLVIEQVAPGAVRLSGELGHDEVDQISYALLLASQGRTQDLDIDLTDVTSVSAGGLGMLGDLVREPAGRASVTLRARRGSVSQVELERAGIDHRAS